MFRAPPLEKRATWNVATIVEPHAKLSGSASVACIAPPPRYGSLEIRRVTVSQSELTLSRRVRGDEVGAAPARDAVTAAARRRRSGRFRRLPPIRSGFSVPSRGRRAGVPTISAAPARSGEDERESGRRQQGGPLHRVPPLPSRSGAMDGYR